MASLSVRMAGNNDHNLYILFVCFSHKQRCKKKKKESWFAKEKTINKLD